MNKKLIVIFAIMFFGLFAISSMAAEVQGVQLQSIDSGQAKSINLSPAAIKQIKANPSFKGLSPQEIQQGLEMLKGKTNGSGDINNFTSKSKKNISKAAKQSQINNNNTSSSFSSLFSYYLKSTNGRLSVPLNLKPFGYDLFKNSVSTPLSFQPVPPNYIIGPGDEIQVLMWGRINAQYTLTVRPDGRVFFPNIGPLMVSGMTYSKMQKFLTDQAKRIIGTNVSISLYKLHQIQVFVLGEVRNPGIHNLPAMSTILNALIASGGPTKRGSLRKIELKRDGKVIDTLDIYNLLLKGDDSHDRILRNNDVIFVPLVGPLVGVAGYVKRPGIYELKNEKDIYSVINLAGGFLAGAWKQMIQVYRFKNHKWQVVVDVKASIDKTLRNVKIQDGDLIKVFPVISTAINSIVLNGNVIRPGVYAYHKGMTLKELLGSKENLLPNTYLKYGLIKRYEIKTSSVKLIPFNLESILSGKENIKLQPLDNVYIFPRALFVQEPVYYIYGAVRHPGQYSSWSQNFRLKNLIMAAGGLKKGAYLNKVEIVSYKVEKDGTIAKMSSKFVNLALAMKGENKDNILLHPYDKVFVRTIPGWGDEITVSVNGEVKFPGTYTLEKGATLSELITKAGGYKNDAYLDGAVLTMPFAQKIQQDALNSLINRLKSEIFISTSAQTSSSVSTQEVQINQLQMLSAEKFINSLKRLKAKGRVVVKLAPLRILEGSPYDIKLEDGAKLFIPIQKDIVSVVGAVMSPSTFIYSKSMSYKDYIKMAGGYTQYADKDNVFVIAADGSAYKTSGGIVRWNPFKSRWEVSSFSKKNGLEPGDTIVVPAKLTYVPWLRNVKDITQMMMQIAVTAGVVLKLF